VVFLSTVESSWEVTGRGCFVMPALWTSGLKIRRTEKIQLKTPTGKVLDTYIHAVELASPGSRLVIGLPPGIAKHDIPEGTEIWLDQQ